MTLRHAARLPDLKLSAIFNASKVTRTKQFVCLDLLVSDSYLMGSVRPLQVININVDRLTRRQSAAALYCVHPRDFLAHQ